MDLFSNYEGPLRSYIQNHIDLLENTLEEEVRNRGNVDISILEEQFDRESDYLIFGITKQIHQIRDEIKGHRPTNIQSADYEIRMIQYRQFLQSSSIIINRINIWINSIVEEIIGIFKNIVQGLAQHSLTIIDILEQIRNAFIFLGTFLHNH